MRFTWWSALAALAAAATVVAAFSIPALAGSGGARKGLSKNDRQLLAEARAEGKQTVVVLIAAKGGANRAVVSGLEGLGATVRYRDDALGYVSARVPVDKVGAAVALDGVEALDVDEVIPLDDPRPEGAQPVTPQTPPGAGTPANNPYMPIGDTGAAQFRAANPTYDGRGVTVGILDSGVSLDHPSLRTTTTPGEEKIVDWVTYTDPTFTNGVNNDADPTWLEMANQVSGSSFVFDGVTYTAPANGSYRIAVFNERVPEFGGELGNDINRDGNPAGSSGKFAVLWDGATKVWVDTDQDNSFADQTAMTDYKVNRDIGYFGTDNPATAIAERMPFVVQTDGKNKAVNIGVVSGAHGSHVAGIVSANAMFGGAMSGAAPGAKLVSVRVCLFIAGCTAHALVEGMIFAAKQANVDVINMSIGGLPALNDGNNARAILYNRLIEQSNVQIFISAGNSGAGLNTVGDPSVASLVMSVASYIKDETWRKNYGSDSTSVDNMHPFSSRGPREDGGFKPQIMAPGSAISTTPMWQGGGPVVGTYDLPPGFSMFNGTSMASPQAAGAAALLVSAAKQANVQKQPAQLRQALVSSARFISGYGAFEQGNGLINVGAAWNLLKQNIKTVDISSSVPVTTVLSGFLATPGIGQGIYDREGVTVGASYVRRYTFVRTSGGGGTTTYNLSWVGNDGTFSSAGSIALGNGSPATLDVTVNAASTGIHSAILNVDDPSTTGIDYQTLNTVVAADRFTAGNNFSVTKTGSIGRNQSTSFFFFVPADTPAFKVDLSGPSATPGTGQARFLRFHPFGVGIDSNQSTSCYSPSAGSCAGSPLSRTTTNPQAGVWEVTVEARRTSDVANTPFTLTASILGASVSPNPDIVASATIGVPVARSYTLTNLFGAFTGRAVGTTLGSAFRATPTIANLAQQQYPVTVTAGSTSLRATIGSPSDPAADLDLFVFNCTSGACVLAGQSADGDSEESVTIANPAAGTWVVLVDGFAVPAGTTTYSYVDVFVNAAFGSVSVTDANALRPAGSSWTVPGSVLANAAPAAGRVLLGNVQVRTDTNILVGQGDVVVQSVTP
jgi:hypothetical protein